MDLKIQCGQVVQKTNTTGKKPTKKHGRVELNMVELNMMELNMVELDAFISFLPGLLCIIAMPRFLEAPCPKKSTRYILHSAFAGKNQ